MITLVVYDYVVYVRDVNNYYIKQLSIRSARYMHLTASAYKHT